MKAKVLRTIGLLLLVVFLVMSSVLPGSSVLAQQDEHIPVVQAAAAALQSQLPLSEGLYYVALAVAVDGDWGVARFQVYQASDNTPALADSTNLVLAHREGDIWQAATMVDPRYPDWVVAVPTTLMSPEEKDGLLAALGVRPDPTVAPLPPEALVPQPPGVERSPPSLPDIFQPLYSKAQREGTIRLVVGLQMTFHPEGDLVSAQSVQNQRLTIAQTQDLLLNQLSAYSVTSVQKFKYIPFMVVEVDAVALAELPSLPEIISIEEDIPVPPALADSVPLIGADKAWDYGYSGAGWTIAILDTGIDKTHPFLAGKVVSEACYSTNDDPDNATTVCPNGLQEQIGDGAGINCSVAGCRHGTHVAGIAAGSGPDFSGVAKDAGLIAIQVFSRFEDDTSNTPCRNSGLPSPCVLVYKSDYVRGLERVYELGNSFNIAAVNISLSGGRYADMATCDAKNESVKRAIDNLRSIGIATVASSGNRGFTDAMEAPGCISTVISVGSTTKSDQVSSFSSSAYWLSLLAPGSTINSSVPGGGFEAWDGTSMAAPHVAGAWAVLKSQSPEASVDQILETLRTTGVPITDPRNGITTPRIQLDRAVGAPREPEIVSLVPADLQILQGSTGTTEVRTTAFSKIYGVDLRLAFDPHVVQVVDADPNTPGVQITVGALMEGRDYSVACNQAHNTAGVIDFCAAPRDPATAIDEGGALASITWQSVNPGTSSLILGEVKLSDRYSNPIDLRKENATVRIIPVESISGRVLLQSRTNHSGTAILLSGEPCPSSANTAAVAASDLPSTSTDSGGSFKIAPFPGGDYQCLRVIQHGYLVGQKSAPRGDLGTITLLGGDVIEDDVINIFDLAFIAGRYRSNDPIADINANGVVDIFDLALAAGNYRQRGPQTNWR